MLLDGLRNGGMEALGLGWVAGLNADLDNIADQHPLYDLADRDHYGLALSEAKQVGWSPEAIDEHPHGRMLRRE